MCGFAGFLSFSPGADAVGRRRVLKAMGDAIAHRGPDDERFYDDGHLGLVFRRLSIVDVQGGAQPFRGEDGRHVLVANGEIYNHEELRAQLRARHRFTGASDCEVALHGWEEWGEGALDRLHGMFALLVWDRQARTLVLARDRLGIKPLYYCELPQGLLFASELKALLAHPECPRDMDWRPLDLPDLVQDCGVSYVQGVRQLEGGELLRVRCDGRIERRHWWRLADHLGKAPLGHDARAYADAYAQLLEQVTREHLQGEANSAIMLSGGLDSSLLAAMAARHNPGLTCLTIVERSSWIGGDVESARRVAQALRLPWRPIRFDHRSLLRDLRFSLTQFEQAVWMMDSPRFELEWVFKGELHRAAKAMDPALKIMLLGQGADEFAGGYSHRQDAPYGSWRDYLREEVQPNLAQARAVREGGRELLRYLSAPPAQQDTLGPYHHMMALLVRQLQHHNLWHEDRSSSWHSLEARVPFLDHRMVELLAGVPAHLHERLFWRKEIVREAWRRTLPAVPLQQEKLGFLEGADTSSCDRLFADLAITVYPGFRERYGSQRGFAFDLQRLDALAARVRRLGAVSRGEARQLVDCMAAAVFQAQCTGVAAAPPREVQPALTVVADRDWPELTRAWAGPSVPAASWSRDHRVCINGGMEVLAPLRGNGQASYVIVADNTIVGRLDVPPGLRWVRDFMRHLGTPATAHFTVQDWLDELDAVPSEFTSLLDMLAFRRVIAPSGNRRERADTEPVPLALG